MRSKAEIILETERMVLGGLLQGGDKVPEVLEHIAEDCFIGDLNRATFRSIEHLFRNGDEIDHLKVITDMQYRGDLKDKEFVAYVANLVSEAPFNVVDHARYLNRYTRERRFLRDIKQLEQDVEIIGIDQAIKQLRESILDALETKGIVTYSDTIEQTATDLLARADSELKIAGIPTNYVDLDQVISGLGRGELIILAGRPSMGKSALALNIIENLAERGRGSLFFSLEMSTEIVQQRSYARYAQINLDALRNGRINAEEKQRISSAEKRLSELPIALDDTGSLTITQVMAKAKAHKIRFGLDLIVVDYLQLMSGVGSSREQEVSSISKGLKNLAKDLNVPVLALAQLNRGVENRVDKQPTLSDLRESGAIEQDADVVMFIYRDEVYNKAPDNPKIGMADIIVGKQRNGPLGRVTMFFKKEYSWFQSAASYR